MAFVNSAVLLEGYMSRAMLFIATFSFLGCLTTPSIAQDSRWGSPDDPLVKFIIAIEAKWASSSCSPQPDLKAVIADDFQGTATNGHRYDKAEAIATDPKALERDCQLGDVKAVLRRLHCHCLRIGKPHPQGRRRQGGQAMSGVDGHVAKAQWPMANRGGSRYRYPVSLS
jgi:hypothetical protein